MHTYSWRGSSQSHSGLSTEDAKKGRKGREAPKLLLASNLGLPAPPGCTGALDWHAPLSSHSTIPSTDDLQASTSPAIELESIDQEAPTSFDLDLDLVSLPTN